MISINIQIIQFNHPFNNYYVTTVPSLLKLTLYFFLIILIDYNKTDVNKITFFVKNKEELA